MTRTPTIAATAALLVLAMSAWGEAAAQYQPFPSGYGYMEPGEIAALKKAVTDRDHKVVRDHGWKLWAGIMQPSSNAPGWPIWFTWPNTTAAFAPPPPPANLRGAAAASVPAGPKKSLIRLNAEIGVAAGEPGAGEIPVNLKDVPYYPIPAPVVLAYPNATDPNKCGANNICDGAHFQFNGDIMIATESLSKEGFDWIRDQAAYQQVTLDEWHNMTGYKDLALPDRYIVTKHMYWPAKAGRLTAIPVWHDYRDRTYGKYAGYETWPDLVAVDPSGQSIGKKATVSYLYGVLEPDQKTPWPTMTASATVHGLNEFYYHQVTQADWSSFNEADKAILNAASYWAYGEPFGPGDFLVTIAMHVNTREIPSWALQSAFWSDQPTAGKYAEDRPKLPQAKGPWDHYLLVDAYGIPDQDGRLPVATNFYIELVSHPVGTDCNNCHIRAGWPATKNMPGTASYQNPDCPDLLAKFSPDNRCFSKYTRTDFQWIIPDRALAPPR